MNKLITDLPFKTKIADFIKVLVFKAKRKDYLELLNTRIDGITLRELLSIYVVDQPWAAAMLKLDFYDSNTLECDEFVYYVFNNLSCMNLETSVAKLIVAVENYLKFVQV